VVYQRDFTALLVSHGLVGPDPVTAGAA
jgi:hypothetical protein